MQSQRRLTAMVAMVFCEIIAVSALTDTGSSAYESAGPVTCGYAHMAMVTGMAGRTCI